MNFRKIIPFWAYPYSWGLTGVDREIARAKYELDGDVLARRLIELNPDTNEAVKKRLLLEHDYKVGSIDQRTFLTRMPELISDPNEKAQAQISASFRLGDITETERDKRLATLNGEPWVTVTEMGFGRDGNAQEGSFELDWNQEFVDLLRKNGVPGITDEDLVNNWFIDVCRSVAHEDFSDGTVDPAANLEAFKRINQNDGLRTYK